MSHKPVPFTDLIPKNSKIKIHNKVYKLKPFTLAVELWATDEFKTPQEPNGLQVLSNRLRDFSDKEAVFKVIYKLIIDKSDFDTYEKFIKYVEEMEQERIYIFITECYYAISDTIGLSQPVIENIEEDIELKKLKAAQ